MNRSSEGPKHSADDNGAAAIARINELTHAARPVWFMLLGYFAFAIITLLGVEDADFFIESRQTQLPLVNVSIPTSSFFLFAPALGAAIYVYFHFQLLKLWEVLAVPSAEIDGNPLADHVTPWLVNDFGLWLRADGSTRSRALSWLSNLVVFVLVFVAGPAALVTFWFRSFPAHDEGTTLVIGAALVFTLAAFFQSIFSAFFHLRLGCSYGGGKWHLFEGLLLIVLAVPIGTISWVATEDSWVAAEDDKHVWPIHFIGTKATKAMTEVMRSVQGTFSLWPADLEEVEIVPRSPNLLQYDVHRSRFRIDWCRRQGLTVEACGPYLERGVSAPPNREKAREKWCSDWQIQPDDCNRYYERLDDTFLDAWRIERRSVISALETRNLQSVDLRSAFLARASLVGADLRSAQLDGADLNDAQLEGADLRDAQLQGANLVGAGLQGADLRNAQLQGANLGNAQLAGADLRDARLQGGNLFWAGLQGADLRGAWLQEANLLRAQLQEANLWGTGLQEATLIGAELQGANLGGAGLQGADLGNAQLAGADLGHAQLQEANLGYAQLQEANLLGARLARADLRSAQLQGAHINGTELKATNLSATRIIGAAVRSVDFTEVLNLDPEQINSAFGDGSVTLPEGWSWPLHWPRAKLNSEELFYGRWRYWRQEQGLPWPPPGKALEWLGEYEAIAPVWPPF